ncbi:MAG: polysaccharide biosynthesis/export family protein [Candidatus Eisenbacteria bacterium]
MPIRKPVPRSTRRPLVFIPGRTLHAIVAGLLVPCLTVGPVLAQTSGSSLQDLLRAMDKDNSADSQAGPGYGAPAWSLETPVDRNRYRVIPGDQMAVGIWSESPITHLLGVTPDGMLVVPKVGPIEVVGHTLDEAEREITAALGKFYPRARITLTLLYPGRFRVSVTGMVAAPGVYELSTQDRLSTALGMAGGITPGGSVRRIGITTPPGHADAASRDAGAGTSATREIDLLPWLVQGSLDANPELRPGEVIDVGAQEGTVTVRGAFNGRSNHRNPEPIEGPYGNRPAEDPELEIEWREGDTLGAILAAAGGLSRLGERHRAYRPGETEAVTLVLADPQTASFLSNPATASRSRTALVGSTSWDRCGSRAAIPIARDTAPREYVLTAGGTTELGRESGWEITRVDGRVETVDTQEHIEPGTKLRIPETRVQTVSRWLGPLTSAAALTLSIIAIAKR